MAFGWITKHEYWHVTTQRCAVTISEGLLPRCLEVMSFPLTEYPPTLWSWLSHFVCLWSSFQSQFLPVIFNYYYYYFLSQMGCLVLCWLKPVIHWKVHLVGQALVQNVFIHISETFPYPSEIFSATYKVTNPTSQPGE